MIHGHIDGMIEPMDEVVEGFAVAPYQGGDHAVWIRGDRGAFDRGDRADVDVAAGLGELLDVRPRRGRRELPAQAASRFARSGCRSTRHGSSSSIRLTGCSAMRSMTCRRYACGSSPCSLAEPTRL